MKVEKCNKFTINFFLILILLIIIFPKINLIPLPALNIHHGIRLDDLIIFSYLIYLLLNIKKVILQNNTIAKKLIIFFPFFLFSILNGYINDIRQHWFFIPRFIEYIFLIFLLENFINNKKIALKICKYVILVNFLFVILQLNDLFGGFTSVRYFAAGDTYLDRPFGLTGGAWEIGSIFSLCFFIIYRFSEKKLTIQNLIFFLMVIFTLYLCETRGTIFAFVITIFFIIQSNFVRVFLIVFLIGSIYMIFPYNDFLNNILKLKPEFLINSLIFFIENGYADKEMYNHSYYYSLGLRLDHIGKSYLMWKNNLSSMIFGLGIEKIYIDSFYFRSLISFGLIGSLIIAIYSLFYLPFIMLIFLGISGITLDHVFSLKIFTLIVLYVHLVKISKNEK